MHVLLLLRGKTDMEAQGPGTQMCVVFTMINVI